MTDRFVRTAEIMAEVAGMPGYPFVVIPHPISSDADGALRAKAADAVGQCVPMLLAR